MEATETIKLTQYSHGAGCGCKISPKVLDCILTSAAAIPVDPMLLVGNDKKDDAAVYDMGNGTAVISTTDFFMPIVDDAFDFGKIASVNAISDVYAMGGKPLIAIAILGWPVNKIPAEVAQQVLEGSRNVCNEAGIPLAGGHSIDSPEPIFGLAVTGVVNIKNIKKNSTATIGSKLFLTKPLGVGILTTAQKKGIVKKEHFEMAVNSMTKLNSLGYELGKLSYVKALTDVTGFGLLGHLIEMSEGSGLTAVIDFKKIPVLKILEEYIAQRSFPGGTNRNWESYSHKVLTGTGIAVDEYRKLILCDPQTSGGLLVAVEKVYENEFSNMLKNLNMPHICFGEFTEKTDTEVLVN